MALTEDQLLLQADILASKTDSTTNPNMAYKTNGTLNKGLNPTYFSGNSTKIVNAINLLAAETDSATIAATNVLNKVNDILMDTSLLEGEQKWAETQIAMQEPTIIEGLYELFSGNKQNKVLDLKDSDIGKFLTVIKDSDGIIRTSTMEVPGLGQAIDAASVTYSNPDRPEFTTVDSALTYLLDNQGTGGGNSGESGEEISDVVWGDILDKPAIATGLVLTESQLCLKAGDENMSSVDLVTDGDIDFIINNL